MIVTLLAALAVLALALCGRPTEALTVGFVLLLLLIAYACSERFVELVQMVQL